MLDIYHAMIRHLEYEVIDVERVEFGHYQAHVRIANLDNGRVAARAVELFKARYDKGLIGTVVQGARDLVSDKSQLAAEMLTQSSDDYYEAGASFLLDCEGFCNQYCKRKWRMGTCVRSECTYLCLSRPGLKILK